MVRDSGNGSGEYSSGSGSGSEFLLLLANSLGRNRTLPCLWQANHWRSLSVSCALGMGIHEQHLSIAGQTRTMRSLTSTLHRFIYVSLTSTPHSLDQLFCCMGIICLGSRRVVLRIGESWECLWRSGGPSNSRRTPIISKIWLRILRLYTAWNNLTSHPLGLRRKKHFTTDIVVKCVGRGQQEYITLYSNCAKIAWTATFMVAGNLLYFVFVDSSIFMVNGKNCFQKKVLKIHTLRVTTESYHIMLVKVKVLFVLIAVIRFEFKTAQKSWDILNFVNNLKKLGMYT